MVGRSKALLLRQIDIADFLVSSVKRFTYTTRFYGVYCKKRFLPCKSKRKARCTTSAFGSIEYENFYRNIKASPLIDRRTIKASLFEACSQAQFWRGNQLL